MKESTRPKEIDARTPWSSPCERSHIVHLTPSASRFLREPWGNLTRARKWPAKIHQLTSRQRSGLLLTKLVLYRQTCSYQRVSPSPFSSRACSSWAAQSTRGYIDEQRIIGDVLRDTCPTPKAICAVPIVVSPQDPE
jgi:hypothetical protein